VFTDIEGKEATLGSFLQQYYDTAYYIPEEVLVNIELEDKELLETWLKDKEGKKITITVPKQGEKKELVDMAVRNAEYNFREHQVRAKLHNSGVGNGVKELANYLGLEVLPYRIAGFDISNIQGTNIVASLVVFENGEPKKSDYRRFKINTTEGQDDFGAMKEVIERRYTRLKDEDKQFPDLILIDGGKGQLNAAQRELEKLGVVDQPIISLAKQEEEIFILEESEPIVLPKDSDALYLVQRVRDEAHRFAVNYHRKLRSRRLTHSMLDDIPGIGDKKRKALLEHFGSLNKVKQASLEELTTVEGIGPALAEEIRDYLKMNLRP
jgi:excinuclease ABC subunit C